MSGLESFMAARHSFDSRGGAHTEDATREFELTHSVLERCLVLCARCRHGTRLRHPKCPRRRSQNLLVPLENWHGLANVSNVLNRCRPVNGLRGSDVLGHRLRDLPAVRKCERQAERAGEEYLPEPLLSFSRRTDDMSNEQAELALVLPRFGKILKWLSVLGKMLQSDEPLKPASADIGEGQ